MIGLGLGAVALAAGVAVLAGAALLLPLIPVLLGALVVWGIVRLMRPSPVAVPRA